MYNIGINKLDDKQIKYYFLFYIDVPQQYPTAVPSTLHQGKLS